MDNSPPNKFHNQKNAQVDSSAEEPQMVTIHPGQPYIFQVEGGRQFIVTIFNTSGDYNSMGLLLNSRDGNWYQFLISPLSSRAFSLDAPHKFIQVINLGTADINVLVKNG